ncbi:Uncharacterized protein M6B38_211635 [Iris pallida]|uniref:GPI-anchored wall transfer protein n=1 Tax=Iris pallida TaxID=29817 RepID=A0AAX6E2T9_IRIPA|nr:Uncharacterized protein M6B38_211635 [Iris pallida]
MDLLGKPLNPNKQMKEEFVSNLTGSSMLEIAALSVIVPALVVLRQFCCSGRISVNEVEKKKDDNATFRKDLRGDTFAMFGDFICVILPLIGYFTVLAEWAFLSAVTLALVLICISAKRRLSSSAHIKEGSQQLYSLRRSISSYRVSMVVVTCLCILAVDFKIFPRRYAKTETYGTSLMDLGVGSFVLANSLVSRQARGAMAVNWKAALRSICPLVFLGFGRLISTTGVDYQVHVGEYGVHWNFFFTLAAVSILTSIVNIPPKYCGIFGIVILIGYQSCLICGLNDYLISNERASNIVSQNKEGFFSIFGYWGLYLVGVHLGYHVFFGHELSSKPGNVQLARIKAWGLTLLFWLLTIIFDKYVERVSRRMCNLAYVTLVLAQNFQIISILFLVDLVPDQKPLVLEEAFNQNLLGSFLLANVLTGVVNLSVDTLSASSFAALAVLVMYALTLSAAVGFAWLLGIKFKFW